MGDRASNFGAVVAAVGLLTGLCAVRAQDGGGGAIAFDPPDGCITPTQRVFVQTLIEDYEAEFGPTSQPVIGRQPPQITFYPLGGALWQDLFPVNYVDLDDSSGIIDWDCLNYTYDGHQGIDAMLRSFDEQLIGVPVFAVTGGTVLAIHDNELDMNTTWGGQPANFVIIDHGLGRQGWYYHLRRNSIMVEVNEFVSGGQQIAECGSSGNSTGPHLHFELVDADSPYEPFAGPCRSGDSGWYAQPEPVREVYLHDFGLTHENLGTFQPWPYRWPASGQFAVTDGWLRVWFYGANLPAQSNWQVRFKRPDGTLTPAGPVQSFNNTSLWKTFSWWWSYDVPEMHSILGTWHVLVYINGGLMVEGPLEVRPERTPDFNRPPEKINLHFDPPAPLAGFAAAVIVETSPTLDDRDYDVLRYQYTWIVNGVALRSVTTAGRSDVLRRNQVKAGDILTCFVTPNDGHVDGETRQIAALVGAPPVPALSGLAAGALAAALVLAATGILLARRPGSDAPVRGGIE